jgi:hypothetical protein
MGKRTLNQKKGLVREYGRLEEYVYKEDDKGECV